MDTHTGESPSSSPELIPEAIREILVSDPSSVYQTLTTITKGLTSDSALPASRRKLASYLPAFAKYLDDGDRKQLWHLMTVGYLDADHASRVFLVDPQFPAGRILELWERAQHTQEPELLDRFAAHPHTPDVVLLQIASRSIASLDTALASNPRVHRVEGLVDALLARDLTDAAAGALFGTMGPEQFVPRMQAFAQAQPATAFRYLLEHPKQIGLLPMDWVRAQINQPNAELCALAVRVHGEHPEHVRVEDAARAAPEQSPLGRAFEALRGIVGRPRS